MIMTNKYKYVHSNLHILHTGYLNMINTSSHKLNPTTRLNTGSHKPKTTIKLNTSSHEPKHEKHWFLKNLTQITLVLIKTKHIQH